MKNRSNKSHCRQPDSDIREVSLLGARIAGGDYDVGVLFPHSYQVAASNLGFHQLYRFAVSQPGVYAHRFVFRGQDSATSLDDRFPLSQCRVILVTLSFEMDYTHLIKILKIARIPSLASQRNEADPLLIIGGVAITANPLSWFEIADAVMLGACEPVWKQLGAILSKWGQHQPGRHARLEDLTQLSSSWIPCIDGLEPTRRIVAARANDMDVFPAQSAWISPDTEFANTFLLEVNRGCPGGCKFCLLRKLQRKPQYLSVSQARACCERAIEQWQQVADELIALNDSKRSAKQIPTVPHIGLVGAGVVSAEYLTELCEYLVDQGARVGTSTLEMDAVTPALLEILHGSGQNTLTLAPERPTESDRFLLGKKISDEVFFQIADQACHIGFSRLKLYFMTGITQTPTQWAQCIPEEVEQLVNFIRKTREVFGKGQIIVSVYPLIPKAGTHWQGFPMPYPSDLKNLNQALVQAFGKLKGVSYRPYSVWEVLLQGVFSQADHTLGQWMIATAHQQTSSRSLFRLLPNQYADMLHDTRFALTRAPWHWID